LSTDSVISIIDDDASVRVATESLVRSMGYAPLTFDSAEAFLVSNDARRTDCIVADIHMPGMSGIELQQALKRRGDTTPIIFITGVPQSHQLQRAMDAGAVSFLKKPFDADILMTCIEKALRRSEKI
jgi:FixJ family two-component response regulator